MPISRCILDLAYDASKRDQLACVANSKKNRISIRCFPFREFRARALGRNAATRFSISSSDRSSSSPRNPSKTVAGTGRRRKKHQHQAQETDRGKGEKEKRKEKAPPKKTGQAKKKPPATKTGPTKKKPPATKIGSGKKKTDQLAKKTDAKKGKPTPVPVARKSLQKKTNLN